MPDMRLAIVIPAYDDPHRLRLCLEGLARQPDAASTPVLIVDDGGPPGQVRAVVAAFSDRLLAICRVYPGPRPRSRLAAWGNLGWRAAGRIGVDRILFLDQDCVAALGVPAAHAAYGAAPIVVTGIRAHVPIDRVSGLTTADVPMLDRIATGADSRLASPWFVTAAATTDVSLGGANGLCAYGCHVSYPAHLLAATGGCDPGYVGRNHQDVDLAVRAGRAGGRLAIRTDLVVYHLDHEIMSGNPENGVRLMQTLNSDVIKYEGAP
jgi:GT2 family glycosyltransferase